jgi:hypothetical protein
MESAFLEVAMGGFKKMWEQRWERLDSGRGRGGVSAQELADIAARLGGEVVDPNKSTVRLRVPGCGAVTVQITGPTSFFVYDTAGPKGAAYAYVRARLGLAARPRPALTPEETKRAIQNILDGCQSAAGTPVEAYLRSRAITILPPLVQYHPRLWHTDNYWPVMVVERTNSAGDVVALHRTFLTEDGAKAPVEPVRKDLGRSTGTVIRLSGRAEELLLGEGIETVLSVMQVTGMPGWAAGSAWALRMAVLPPWVRRVIILVDMDDDGEGERAAYAVCARMTAEGREVKLARAPRDKDFNDLLMEQHNG